MSEEKKYDKPAENLNRFQHFVYDYGRYHHNIVNILVHVVCVPIIIISLLRMTSHASKVYLDSDFNYGYLIPILATPLYIYVDFFVGIITSLEYFVIDFLLINFTFEERFFGLNDWQTWLLIHVIAWIAQFIGHGFFEKRKPALMDNFLLTLNAPIFVNLETFYFLFNYRKEELKEVEKYVINDIKRYRGEKKE